MPNTRKLDLDLLNEKLAAQNKTERLSFLKNALTDGKYYTQYGSRKTTTEELKKTLGLFPVDHQLEVMVKINQANFAFAKSGINYFIASLKALPEKEWPEYIYSLRDSLPEYLYKEVAQHLLISCENVTVRIQAEERLKLINLPEIKNINDLEKAMSNLDKALAKEIVNFVPIAINNPDELSRYCNFVYTYDIKLEDEYLATLAKYIINLDQLLKIMGYGYEKELLLSLKDDLFRLVPNVDLFITLVKDLRPEVDYEFMFRELPDLVRYVCKDEKSFNKLYDVLSSEVEQRLLLKTLGFQLRTCVKSPHTLATIVDQKNSRTLNRIFDSLDDKLATIFHSQAGFQEVYLKIILSERGSFCKRLEEKLPDLLPKDEYKKLRELHHLEVRHKHGLPSRLADKFKMWACPGSKKEKPQKFEQADEPSPSVFTV